MNLNEYQKQARTTAHSVKVEGTLPYPVIALAGEVGEFANKAKKIYRDDGGTITEERRKELLLELGDVLWYVSEIASQLNISLEEVAQMNVEKLVKRKQEGKIMGSGDHR